MFHVDIIPIVICFIYTSWHFYAFSGTNLLTRCHSASSCFLQFLYSRKASLEIFSELDETWTGPPIFPTRTRSPKERRRGATRQPHHGATWAPCHAVGWCGAHVRLQPPPFRLFIHLHGKTLDTRAIIHEKFQRRRRHQP